MNSFFFKYTSIKVVLSRKSGRQIRPFSSFYCLITPPSPSLTNLFRPLSRDSRHMLMGNIKEMRKEKIL